MELSGHWDLSIFKETTCMSSLIKEALQNCKIIWYDNKKKCVIITPEELECLVG